MLVISCLPPPNSRAGRPRSKETPQFEGGAPSLQPSFEAIPRSEGAPPSIWPRFEAVPRSEGTFAYSNTSGLSLRVLLTLSLTGRTA